MAGAAGAGFACAEAAFGAPAGVVWVACATRVGATAAEALAAAVVSLLV